MTISDGDLVQLAKETLNPRSLSKSVDVGSVASALLTQGGNTYIGVCIDTACSLGFCAEHNAIGSMITAGESRIEMIVAVRENGDIISPCGRCRELIYQVDAGNAKTRVLLKDNKVAYLADLLPEYWQDDA